jgi:large subunit ribosomal protein L19
MEKIQEKQMKNIEEINKASLKKILTTKKIPKFFAGDTIKVGVRIVEGKRERIQYFEGVCIAKKNRSINSSFTVRKISFGEGVERTFALYSPIIGSIKVVRSGLVRRAKLYYLRDRKGKSARISEKIKKKIGIDVSEQVVENEIIKEEPKKENLIKDKDIVTKTDLKKEKLKTEKKIIFFYNAPNTLRKNLERTYSSSTR